MAFQKKTEAFLDEIKAQPKVSIRIPIINGDNSDVPVRINGHIWQIKRGETVEVPQVVADLLIKGKYI